MIRALAASSLSLLVGAGAAGGLAWAFLNTPESTVFMLGVSTLLVLAIYVAVAIAVGAALAAWNPGPSRPFGRIAHWLVLFLPALVAVGVSWWLLGTALDAIEARAGEIAAWFIATLDWADVRPLLRALDAAGEWIRRILVPFAALTWLAHGLSLPSRGAPPSSWLRRAMSPLRLVFVTLIAAATLWAPFAYGTYWMPRGLPPTWVEPAVAVVKFAAMAALGAVGLSLILRTASPSPDPADGRPSAATQIEPAAILDSRATAPQTTSYPR